MADMFDKAKRSEIMSRVRAKETSMERVVFKYLRSNHVYFQKHYKRALGTPDIALPRKKKAVFIDGDFWHGRTYKKLMSKNGINEYWQTKLERNMARDKQQRSELVKQGWLLLCVWESDIKRMSTRQQKLEEIQKFLIN